MELERKRLRVAPPFFSVQAGDMPTISRQEVAARQLDAAIHLFAEDYDVVIVHTIASAAFQLYVLKLKEGGVKQAIEEHLQKGQEQQFWHIVNRPYNFFKHGEYNYKPLESIDYDPNSIDFLLLAASDANRESEKQYRLRSALIYKAYASFCHPEILVDTERSEAVGKLKELLATQGIELPNKAFLKHMLSDEQNFPS